jgi:hypothetical protein
MHIECGPPMSSDLPTETPAIRTAILEKISRKSLEDLQAYVSLVAYIYHILSDRERLWQHDKW